MYYVYVLQYEWGHSYPDTATITSIVGASSHEDAVAVYNEKYGGTQVFDEVDSINARTEIRGVLH